MELQLVSEAHCQWEEPHNGEPQFRWSVVFHSIMSGSAAGSDLLVKKGAIIPMCKALKAMMVVLFLVLMVREPVDAHEATPPWRSYQSHRAFARDHPVFDPTEEHSFSRADAADVEDRNGRLWAAMIRLPQVQSKVMYEGLLNWVRLIEGEELLTIDDVVYKPYVECAKEEIKQMLRLAGGKTAGIADDLLNVVLSDVQDLLDVPDIPEWIRGVQKAIASTGTNAEVLRGLEGFQDILNKAKDDAPLIAADLAMRIVRIYLEEAVNSDLVYAFQTVADTMQDGKPSSDFLKKATREVIDEYEGNRDVRLQALREEAAKWIWESASGAVQTLLLVKPATWVFDQLVGKSLEVERDALTAALVCAQMQRAAGIAYQRFRTGDSVDDEQRIRDAGLVYLLAAQSANDEYATLLREVGGLQGHEDALEDKAEGIRQALGDWMAIGDRAGDYRGSVVVKDERGSLLPGVTLKFTGSIDTTKHSADGRWSGSQLVGEITIVPSKPGFEFRPKSQVIKPDLPAPEFTGYPLRPARPANLTAVATGSQCVDLKWENPCDYTQGFEIWCKGESDAEFKRIAKLDYSNDPTLANRWDVQGDATYLYKVKAYNHGAFSDFSDVASVTTVRAPVDLVAKASSPTHVDLSWVNTSGLPHSVVIERKIGDDGAWQYVDITINASSYTDTRAVSGPMNYYRLRATIDGGGVSDWTEEVGATYTYSVSGRVMNENQGVEGAVVTASGEYFSSSDTVGADGRWKIDGIQGPVAISVEKPDYTFVPRGKHNARAEDTAADIDFDSSYSLTGRAVDSSGNAIAGVRIDYRCFDLPGVSGYVPTNPDGSWSISGLSGTVSLTASKTGVTFVQPTYEVSAPSDALIFEQVQGDWMPEATRTALRRAYEEYYIPYEEPDRPIPWETFCEYSRPFPPKPGANWDSASEWAAGGLGRDTGFLEFARSNPISLAARCLFAENRSATGQIGRRAVRATATVIANRAKDGRYGGTTVSDTILAQDQFSSIWDTNTGTRNPILHADELELWCYCVHIARHLCSKTRSRLWSEIPSHYFSMHDIACAGEKGLPMPFLIYAAQEYRECTADDVTSATHLVAGGTRRKITASPIRIGAKVFFTYAVGNEPGWWEQSVITIVRSPVTAVPSGLSAVATSSNSVRLTWTNSNEHTYTVLIQESPVDDNACFQTVRTIDDTHPSEEQVVLERAPGAFVGPRYYRVVLRDYYGSTSTSNTARAVLMYPPDLRVGDVTSAGVSLAWSSASSWQHGFKVERSTLPESGYVQIATVGADVRTYEDAVEVQSGAAYYYRVRAYNDSGSDVAWDDDHSSYSSVRIAAFKGSVSGVVVDQDGNGLEAVGLNFFDASSGRRVAATSSAAGGMWSVSGQVRTARIAPIKEGLVFVPETQQIHVPSDGVRFTAFPDVPGEGIVTQATAGSGYSLALKSDGTVWACGDNQVAQLVRAPGDALVDTVPRRVIGIDNVKSVAASGSNLALKNDGTVWEWGVFRLRVLFEEGTAAAVASGGTHNLALAQDGAVWAWGTNTEGQLGNGTLVESTVPVQVVGLDQVKAIAAGSYFSVALKSDGTVWTWGSGNDGQLGNGHLGRGVHSAIPVQVLGLSRIIGIAAGSGHCLAVRSDGSLWAWGRNKDGQLGNGDSVSSAVPVQVMGLDGVIAVAAGQGHSLAVNGNGTVWAWGDNRYGQLGDGTHNNSLIPVQVADIEGVIGLGGGQYHSIALTSCGDIWAWGRNRQGQLGDGTRTDRAVPVKVSQF